MITVNKIGRRYYLVGNSFPYRDQFRAAGAHWWVIPRELAAQAQRLRDQCEAAASRVTRSMAQHDLATALIEQRLRDLDEIVSVMDARITPVLNGEVRMPRDIRDRMLALVAERNVCDDAVVPAISCRIIEICRDFALGRTEI